MDLKKQLLNPINCVLVLGALVPGTQMEGHAATSARRATATKKASVKKSKTAPKTAAQVQATRKQMERISAKVRAIIVDQLSVDASIVKPHASFVKDLGADSLDVVELVMRFEEEFEIAIPDEDAEKLHTVASATNYILRKKKLPGVPVTAPAKASPPTKGAPKKMAAPSRSSYYKNEHPYLQAGEAIARSEQVDDFDILSIDAMTTKHRKFLMDNAPALRMARQGFTQQYREPTGEKFFDPPPLERFAMFTNVSRLLVLEGRDKELRGDQVGAVNSYTDAIRLGLDLMHNGPGISMIDGISCETLGRHYLWQSKEKWNAEAARLAAQRLETLEATRVPYSKILAIEKQHDLYDLQAGLRDGDAGAKREAQAIVADFSRFADAMIASANKPFISRQKVPAPRTARGRFMASTYGDSTWVVALGDKTQNALLMTTLALRAFQQERGNLPESLSELEGQYLRAIPADVFAANSPLLYKRDAANPLGYVLYSIGPDGKDDGGKAIDTPAWGAAQRRTVLWDRKGDIVAGINLRANYYLVVGE